MMQLFNSTFERQSDTIVSFIFFYYATMKMNTNHYCNIEINFNKKKIFKGTHTQSLETFKMSLILGSK